MSFNKCIDHKNYDSLSWDDFQIMMIEDGYNADYVCDVDYQDYGYEYCKDCEKLIQTE